MERVFLQLFPKASGLLDYPCADAWEFRDSFAWVDNATAAPGEEDVAEMGKVVHGMIEWCARPVAFLSGAKANVRRTPFLRVLFCLLLRSRREITADQARTVLGLFAAFRAATLVNDASTLELIRVVQGLPASAAPVIEKKFIEIASAVMTATFSNASKLEAGYFVVFFDTFASFLARRPALAEEFLHASFFRSMLERIVANRVKAAVKHFLKFTSVVSYHLHEFLGPHLKVLPHGHQNAMRDIINRIPENGSNDECYTAAVEYVLQRIGMTVNEAILLLVPIN
jgi:hypothetical protein